MEKRFLFLSDRPLITNSRFIGREFSPRGLMRDFLRSISTFFFLCRSVSKDRWISLLMRVIWEG